MLEVDQGGKLLHAIDGSNLDVINLNKADPDLVRVVVNVLQSVQGFLRLLLAIVEQDQKVVDVLDHDRELLLFKNVFDYFCFFFSVSNQNTYL